MNSRTKQILIIAGVIIVLLVVGWLLKARHSAKEEAAPAAPQTQNADNQASAAAPAGEDQASTWTGTLKASANPAKGNLVLVTSDQTIYIKTSRDFASLVGKTVKVTYQGTPQNFVLGDITLAEQQ